MKDGLQCALLYARPGMSTLQRLTTEYVEAEDRIRVSGERADGSTVLLWFTQRLLNRLVPHLTAWLVRQGVPASGIPSVQAVHEDVVQGFAQQAARAQLAPEPPVRAWAPQAAWRVDAVDITPGEDAVLLVFKGEAGAQAALHLATQPLRQWLAIVFEQFLRGEWPTTAWPAWMEDARAPVAPGAVALH